MNTALLFHRFFLLALAAVLSFFSFMFFGFPQRYEATLELDSGIVLNQSALAEEDLSLTYSGRDSLKILEGAQYFLTLGEEPVFELYSGTALLSGLSGELNLDVKTPFAQTNLDRNQFAMRVQDEEMSFYVTSHALSVSLLSEGEIVGALDLLQNTKLDLLASKLTSNLSALDVLKLQKEFPLQPFELSDLGQDLNAALILQDELYEQASLRAFAAIQERRVTAFSQLGDALRSSLTFFNHAKLKQARGHSNSAMHRSMFHALLSNEAESERWLSEWNPSLDLPLAERWGANLFAVLPGDDLYPHKEKALSSESTQRKLRRHFYEIEALIDRFDPLSADLAYETYKTQLSSALESGLFEDRLNQEYLLLESLLRSHFIFYSRSDLEVLSTMEFALLAASESQQERDEQRQAFVQSKLLFLGALFDAVLEKQVSKADAQDLASTLIEETDLHLREIQGSVAILPFFEEERARYALALDFLASPEFDLALDFESGLEAYLQKVEGLTELEDYLSQIRVDEAQNNDALPLEEALSEAGSDLSFNQVQYAELLPLGDSYNRLFSLEGGRTGGQPFQAKYDRVTGLLYDIDVEGTFLSSGLNLEQAREVIPGLFDLQEPTLAPLPNENNAEVLTLKERVSLERAEQLFVQLGFENALLLILEDGTFEFSGRFQSRYELTGVYHENTGLLSQVTWIDEELEYALSTYSAVDFSERALEEIEALGQEETE